MPDNIADFTVPLGVPEIMRYGDDITVVSYGSTLRVVEEACNDLENWACPSSSSMQTLPIRYLWRDRTEYPVRRTGSSSLTKMFRVGPPPICWIRCSRTKELSSAWMPCHRHSVHNPTAQLMPATAITLQTQRRRHLRSHL